MTYILTLCRTTEKTNLNNIEAGKPQVREATLLLSDDVAVYMKQKRGCSDALLRTAGIVSNAACNKQRWATTILQG